MGTGNLTKLPSAPTEVESNTEDLNQIIDSLEGNIVMRNTSGVVTDGAGDIGQINSGRPDRIHVKTAITVGGQTLNTAPFLLSKNGVQSGAEKTSGFPNFLSPAGGTTRTFSILGATTPLNMTIDGEAKELDVDLTSDTLALAPSSNNTCTINNAIFDGSDFTKTAGEFGYWIDIDSVGSEISSLDGTIQCFKHGSGPEVFLAIVDTTNNKLIPISRGIGGTQREAMSDNDVITLLAGHFIFLDNDLLTIDTSSEFPTWGGTSPTSPAVGKYWMDMDSETWKRYSGSTWETLHRIYLGYAICDSAGCKWVEHIDFNLAWNSNCFINQVSVKSATEVYIDGDFTVNVAGKELQMNNYGLDLTVSDNLESGVSIVANRWYYLYLSKSGNFYFSDKCPRKYDGKLGLYHPNEYWRAISVFMIDGSGELFPLINRPSDNTINLTISNSKKVTIVDTGINYGSYDIYNLLIPPIISKAKLRTYFINSGGNISGNIYFKELNRHLSLEDIPAGFSSQRDSVSNLSYLQIKSDVDMIRNSLLSMWAIFNSSGGTTLHAFDVSGLILKF